jgi:hypothetical protein
MRVVRAIVFTVLGLALTACGSSRSNSADADAISQAANSDIVITSPDADLKISNVTIRVPETLVVSEENRYYPSGDIVWRGDPPGDRRAQVKAIFEDGIGRGTATLDGSTAYNLDIEVLRFHALTEKARYSIGGIHSITFQVTLTDPATGATVGEPRIVQADLPGYGGDEAIAADAQGFTQKFRITNHLANVIVVELTDPEGYSNARLGVLQTINNT